MKRTEKIKEIENLIARNKYSRRKFMDSLAKTVALSSLAAVGIISYISCEKDLPLTDHPVNYEKSQPYYCDSAVLCLVPNSCITAVNCPDNVNCGENVHQGGSGS